MKKIAVLGSTGSIGKSLADIVRNNPDKFKITALSSHNNVEEAVKQIKEFKPKLVSVADDNVRLKILKQIPNKNIEILIGLDGLKAVASYDDSDMVVSAVVGSIGLLPLMEAIKNKKAIALANKEALVMAGDIVMAEAKKKGIKIIPVDSEHSAIFQCLNGQDISNIKSVIITASGGPFRNKTRQELVNITPDEAARHPRWNMGKKISVDSATLMNKGLEVIEAKWLFNLDINQIKVIIHPQSIIHSMVEYIDNSIIAQMSAPDMRIAIQYALTYPKRFKTSVPALDLIQTKSLTFEEPDFKKFPCLDIAIKAGKKGGSAPAILNAANETAVSAFLQNKIKFLDIADIVKKVLDKMDVVSKYTIEEIIEIDRKAREIAFGYL